jgi:hypothetical protein
VGAAFSRAGDTFVVRTDNGNGGSQDYEVAYTFGVYPLQQYLIAFPERRLQALGVAWDSRPKEQGGSAGSSFIPIRKCRAMTGCIGRDAIRPGITYVPTATAQICRRTMTLRQTPTQPLRPI